MDCLIDGGAVVPPLPFGAPGQADAAVAAETMSPGALFADVLGRLGVDDVAPNLGPLNIGRGGAAEPASIAVETPMEPDAQGAEPPEAPAFGQPSWQVIHVIPVQTPMEADLPVVARAAAGEGRLLAADVALQARTVAALERISPLESSSVTPAVPQKLGLGPVSAQRDSLQGALVEAGAIRDVARTEVSGAIAIELPNASDGGREAEGVTPEASTSTSRPIARALEALERSTAAAAVTGVGPPPSDAAAPQGGADIEGAVRSGVAVASDNGPTSVERRAPRAESVSAPMTRPLAPEPGGNTTSFAGSSDEQAASARQEYGRRVFAAAAAFEPAREAAPQAEVASLAPDVIPAAAADVSAPVRLTHASALTRTTVPKVSAEDADVVPQLVRAIRTQFRDGVGEARIRLNPEHLGEVRIEIKIDGDRVSARLQVERPDVRQAIEAESHSLRLHLAAQGLTLDDLTVTEDSRLRDQRGGTDERHRGQDRPPQERRPRRDQPEREFELFADE